MWDSQEISHVWSKHAIQVMVIHPILRILVMWETQCNNPTIWEWFQSHPKKCYLGMVYGIGLI